MDLLYTPAPIISAEFQKEFDRIVPTNPQTGQKFLRYVWGCDRKETIGAVEFCRYADDACKYVGKPRWVLEGWQPPTVLDRAQWEAKKDVLGDFPHNGVWDFLQFHEDAEGNFLPLDHTAIKRLEEWRYWKGQGRKRSLEQLIKAKEARYELAQATKQARLEETNAHIEDGFARYFANPKAATLYSLPSFRTTASGLIVPK